MRYLREWKKPDKGGECGTDIPSRLTGLWTQLGCLVVKKKNKQFFFKYQPSHILAGVEVKPTLQVFTFCTQRLALPHASATCHSRATLLTSRRASGAGELTAALRCPDGAAGTTNAHRAAGSAANAGRRPSSPH